MKTPLPHPPADARPLRASRARRGRLVAVAVAAALGLSGCAPVVDESAPSVSPSPSTTGPDAPLESSGRVAAELAALETEYGATIGVLARDTSSGASIAFGQDRRFGFASTMKAPLAGVFLDRVEGAARDEVVRWSAAQVEEAGYAPVTAERIDEGLTLAELAEAAVRQSDNLAFNLVLERLGGPAALDAALAELGDETTEVVNLEPALNTIEPGSTDDTTTAAALAGTLEALLLGPTLDADDRTLLLDWMSGNATGDTLIRAGAPEGWVVADKSGGAGAIRNDVALVTRPDGAPIVIAVLTQRDDPEAERDDSLVARAAEIALDAFADE
ncbi:class A beta-lactamase [Yonghaparkia sp. Root332]|uniref:class A beta-lactamase n=1 Tax=Yonghaparkia sp. Root332 TaxID=1736516 RepID=UPI0009EB5DF5|nr:class A beta-lactamase [Yonghaparkia sp. Root332]